MEMQTYARTTITQIHYVGWNGMKMANRNYIKKKLCLLEMLVDSCCYYRTDSISQTKSNYYCGVFFCLAHHPCQIS